MHPRWFRLVTWLHESTKGRYRYSSTHTQPWRLKVVDGWHGPASLPLEKRPGIPRIGSWVGLRASLDGYRRTYPPLAIEPWTIQLIANHYTNYTNTENMQKQTSFVTNSYVLGFKSFHMRWHISFSNSYNFYIHTAPFSTNYSGNEVLYTDSSLLGGDIVSLGV
jgi:hypothetical protein